jgi:RimJ/RimL family protein N-acetyltransferase
MVVVLADEKLYEFTGGEAPTYAALQQRYARQLRGPKRPGEYWFNWIIRAKPDQRAVGFVQATVNGRSADIAWLVGVKDQRTGIATEASLALCEWLSGVDIEEAHAHIHLLHAASQYVADRIGMAPTGELDDEGEEIWSRRLD